MSTITRLPSPHVAGPGASKIGHRISIAGYLTAALLLLAALMPLQGAAQSPADDIALSLGLTYSHD